ncbi:MAG: Signal recognition particle core component [Piccolia ochrophora]|nr:MAG: Signal recognition particle core component [Piccolia ochrophora]
MASSQSLSALLQRATLDDEEEVLKAANATLKKSKNDLHAQHVKVVALLKLDRYDDTLRFLEDGGDKLKSQTTLERAYALYKLGQWEEAEDLVSKATASRGLRHVEAQTAYRLEKFPRAADIYENLSSKPSQVLNETNDLRINSSAVDAQLEWAGDSLSVRKRKFGREDLEAFETAYNAGCSSVARGGLRQGEILLQRAKELCNSTDLSDDDKKAELLPISVQQVYVLLRLGKVEQAQSLSQSLSTEEYSHRAPYSGFDADPLTRKPELSTQKIAQNNALATGAQSTNAYDAQKTFNSIQITSRPAQPFKYQSDVLHRNAYALDLACLKYTGVASSTSRLISKHPQPTTTTSINLLSVVNAAAHARNQLGKAGLKSILPLLEKRPNDIGLLLTIVQLYILTNNHGAATSLFEALMKRLEQSKSEADQDVRFAPGLIAVLVSLYNQQGRKSQSKSELTKAAAHWRRKSKASATLLRAAGVALLDSTKEDDIAAAADIFHSLRRQEPSDRIAIAGFVAANATKRPEEVVEEADKLTPVSRLTAGIDASALEEAGVPSAPAKAAPGLTKKRAAEDSANPAKKRIRKSRLPKSYDASKPPDPERWLPLRDRSTYKPKGKKGKQKAATLTQGGVSTPREAESLDLAGGAGAVKVEKAGGVGGAKKKKGKGGKR